jgi:hypothetical protein
MLESELHPRGNLTVHLKPLPKVNRSLTRQLLELSYNLVGAGIHILLQLNDRRHAVRRCDMSSSNRMSFFVPLREQAWISSRFIMPRLIPIALIKLVTHQLRLLSETRYCGHKSPWLPQGR